MHERIDPQRRRHDHHARRFGPGQNAHETRRYRRPSSPPPLQQQHRGIWLQVPPNRTPAPARRRQQLEPWRTRELIANGGTTTLLVYASEALRNGMWPWQRRPRNQTFPQTICRPLQGQRDGIWLQLPPTLDACAPSSVGRRPERLHQHQQLLAWLRHHRAERQKEWRPWPTGLLRAMAVRRRPLQINCMDSHKIQLPDQDVDTTACFTAYSCHHAFQNEPTSAQNPHPCALRGQEHRVDGHTGRNARLGRGAFASDGKEQLETSAGRVWSDDKLGKSAMPQHPDRRGTSPKLSPGQSFEGNSESRWAPSTRDAGSFCHPRCEDSNSSGWMGGGRAPAITALHVGGSP